MIPTLFSVSYAGLWGQQTLDLEAFIRKAAKLGYSAVELMGKRPHLSVLDCGQRELLDITGDRLGRLVVGRDHDHVVVRLESVAFFRCAAVHAHRARGHRAATRSHARNDASPGEEDVQSSACLGSLHDELGVGGLFVHHASTAYPISCWAQAGACLICRCLCWPS